MIQRPLLLKPGNEQRCCWRWEEVQISRLLVCLSFWLLSYLVLIGSFFSVEDESARSA